MNQAEFQELGLYDPNAPDATERLALLEYLAGLGATKEDLTEFRSNYLRSKANSPYGSHLYREIPVVAHEKRRSQDVCGDFGLSRFIGPEGRHV